MFEKILVPVDGSETSWKAMEEAKKLAEAFRGEMVVVNVIQPYNNAALLVVPLDQATISQGNEELTKIGNSVLETAKEKMQDFKGKKNSFLKSVIRPRDHCCQQGKGLHVHCHRQPRPVRHCRILPGQRQFQGFPVCFGAGPHRKIRTAARVFYGGEFPMMKKILVPLMGPIFPCVP